MTEETREILSAGRECYAALKVAQEIFLRDKKRKIPKKVRQALERSKPILYGDHLAERGGGQDTRMISDDPGYYD